MTKSTTKKALALSILSMLLCCAMLVGSTFAWFSDSASAGNNKIVAGNLDVELLDAEGNKLEDSIFDEDFLWEPGAMMVSDTFKVANVGKLTLVYDLSTAVVAETLVNGHSLSEVVKAKVVRAKDVAKIADTQEARADLWDSLEGGKIVSKAALKPGATSSDLVVVLYWAPNDNAVDNVFNLSADDYTAETAPSITFAINVYATQYPSEEDSFGPNYDKLASSTLAVHTAVANGVSKMNSLMANGGYAQLSELVVDPENDHSYVTTVTMDSEKAADVTVRDVYNDIGETLFGEVIAQSANITKIAVVTSLGNSELETNGGDITTLDLVGLVAESLGGEAGAVAGYTIDVLAGEAISVTITDISGTSTTYTLNFVFGE